MANFQTHFSTAIVVSSIAASSVMSLQLVSADDIVVLWLLGALGGLLPDIDSDDSTSLRIIFNLLGLTAALCCGTLLYSVLSLTSLWLFAGLTFALVRYALMPLFENLTVHRGTVHSLLACTIFALAAVQLSLLNDKSIVFAWCSGLFILMGMLVHLSLDELYSVDLSNMAFKRSFGSALKPLSLSYPLTTISHLIICAALIYLAPPLTPLLTALEQSQFNFLPWQDWANLRQWAGY